MRVILIAIGLLLFALPALATLTCEVRLGACTAGYAGVFKMSNTSDAHAELLSEGAYSYTVCCRETYGTNASLGTGCSGTYINALNLSGSTNAHAALNNETGYGVTFCINSTNNISFGYAASCAGFDACIASISGNTNAHVGNCSAYSTQVCIQARNMTVNITEGNGRTVSTQGFQTVNLTVSFHDQASDIRPENVSGRIWVSKQGTFVGYDCTSNSQGNCTVKFDPDCDFLGGAATWLGGVFGDDLYNDVNSTTGTITIDTAADCSQTVAFQMEFNISGTANDAAEVDGLGAGVYKSGELQNYYSCVQDTSLPKSPAFGLVFAGTTLDHINLTSGTQGGSFAVKISQLQSSNRFIIPATIDGCGTIRNRMPDIRQGVLTQPFAAFIGALKNPLEVILSYPSIDIVGDFSKSGTFAITLEKNETNGIAQIIVGE